MSEPTSRTMASEYFQGFAKGMGRREAAGTPFSRSGVPGFGFLGRHLREQLEEHLCAGRSIAVQVFALADYEMITSLYGASITDILMGLMEDEVRTLSRTFCGDGCLVHVTRLDRGKIMLLCGRLSGRKEQPAETAHTIRLRLKAGLKRESLKLTGQVPEVSAGFAVIHNLGRDTLEDALYAALCDAQLVARGAVDETSLPLLDEFRTILSQRMLGVVYQPILDLRESRVMAWEALTRGPGKSSFADPSVLFDFAEEADRLFDLEKACRETAVSRVGELEAGQKLFLNIHPRTMVDPGFSPGETLKLLAEYGLGPANIVFEITERHSLRDFTLFHRTLEHYRSQGFKVAVDDVGTGYSGLWTIAELRPDYLKVDMSLIRDIDRNPVKRALIETFVTFAEKIGCGLIAEGIETAAELSCLRGMGVHYGQGYHLARPAYPRQTPKLEGTAADPARAVKRELKCALPVGELVEPAHGVAPDTQVSRVKSMLQGEDPISAVVVVQGERPKGLIMSHHMDRALSTRYGMSLYYNRDASRIMDPDPLVIDAATPAQNAARAAMNRDKYKIYDHLVITDEGRLRGIVSVQKLLDTLAMVQVEMAKGANPLTGLPGNVGIETELERRGCRGEAFSIIYADLDNFKVYNDSYGFKQGDDVILLLSRIMTWAVKRHGSAGEDFTGHVGGDDFVCITAPERAERICRAVARCFGRLVRRCYNETDRARGFVTAKSRAGETGDYPLVSVSLAIVDCVGSCDLEAISRRSAEMKAYAKTLAGNSWVRDRRDPLGATGCPATA